jgi:hypothetical protein
MDTISINILNPKVKEILENLESLNLITVNRDDKKQLKDIITRIRKKSTNLTIDEITKEVEAVRSKRYGK